MSFVKFQFYGIVQLDKIGNLKYVLIKYVEIIDILYIFILIIRGDWLFKIKNLDNSIIILS